MILATDISTIAWLVGALLGIGGGLYFFSIYDDFSQLLKRLVERRRSYAYRVFKNPQGVVALPRDVILGLSDIPWNRYYLISFLVGALLYLFFDVPMLYKIIYISLPLWVVFWKSFLRGQAEKKLDGQIRRFYSEVRIVYSLRKALLVTLMDLADNPPEDNILYRQLASVFSGGRPGTASETLRRFSEILGSDKLKNFSDAAAASESGDLDIDQYLAEQAQLIAEASENQLREELQALPLRIVMFAVPFLLLPILVMATAPLSERAVTMIGGFSGP